MYIFLDESGNFKGGKDDYFVVGGFVTGDPKRTARIFRKWQHTKFPKKLRRKAEVKFSDTGLNEKLRLKTLNYFTKQDIRIFYTFLKKSNIPIEYRKKNNIETGFLYTEIVAKTLHLLLPAADLEFRVSRDNRQLKKVSQAKFNEIIKLDLLPELSAKTIIQISSIDSVTDSNIQIADWVCGALFHYYNKRNNGKSYISLLKNSVIASEELFKDYWNNFSQNKKPPFER